MIAYDKTGAVFALTEGTDLLLHDGPSEGPLWQRSLDGAIVGVGITADQVCAVTAAGTAQWFTARQDSLLRTVQLDARTEHAAIDVAADRLVAITERGVLRVAGDETTKIADDRGACIALAPDGTTAIGTASELVTIALDGTRTACTLAGPARGVAHHPGGFWLVSVGRSIYRCNGTEVAHVTTTPGEADHIACSMRAIAVGWDAKAIAVLAWPSKETLGSVSYVDRKCEGVAFGPWPWVGIGMDLGDGNKFNLETIQLHRSDTHPGREHHRWLVSVGGPPDDKPAPRREAPSRQRAPQAPRFPIAMALFVAAVAIAIFMLVR